MVDESNESRRTRDRRQPRSRRGDCSRAREAWIRAWSIGGARCAMRSSRRGARPAAGRARTCTVAGDITDAPVRATPDRRRPDGSAVCMCSSTTRRSLDRSGRSRTFDVPRFGRLFPVNVGAPLALIQLALPLLAERAGLIVNITSDAATAAYPGWGPYGATKAALELLTRTLASELREHGVSAVLVDPGDMRTRMHQEAFPGQDISDRPLPEVTVPFWNWLFDQDPGCHPRRTVRRAAGGCPMAAAGVIEAFALPAHLEATEPPEARGLRRDDVRLLVSRVDSDSIAHARVQRSAAMALGRRSAGRQHQRNAERGADRRRTSMARNSSCTCRRGCREISGSLKCGGQGQPRRCRTAMHARGRVRAASGGARVTLLAPYPLIGGLEPRVRGCGWPRCTAASHSSRIWSDSAAQFVTAT